MVKRRVPNIVRGGKAIPIKGKTNYYYMSGRKHENGGIDIGKNPRTGLEVEDGEVMHIGKNEIKVFSAQPFLNGKSPAQRVMQGDNPDKVFNAQEEYKDRNRLNDDGTKVKYGNRKQAELGILNELGNYYNIVKHNINAGVNYIKRKFSDEEEKPNATVIRLNNKKVSRITPTTDNAESILFNDFVEDNPNNIRLAKDFKNTNDTLIGDKKIPLNKISYYYGIENDKLKVGSLNNFNDNTIVIPVRNKNIGKIKKIILDNIPSDSIDYYKNKISELSELSSNEKNKIYDKYADDNNIEPSITDYISSLYGINPKTIAGRKAYLNKYKRFPISEYDKEINTIHKKLINPISFITENNDTIDSRIAQMSGGAGGYKIVLGDEKGNSYFINRLKDIDKKELDKLNKEIENNPVYPVMVDNGRYSHFYENADNLHNYNTYTANDFYRDPKNIFVVGTKKQYGGNMIASINGNVKNGLIHTEMKCGGRKKAKNGTIYINGNNLLVPDIDIPKKIIIPKTTKTNTNNISSFIKNNPDEVDDYISLASNIGSNLIGRAINNKALNKMSYSFSPIPKRAVKLKTNININPQLDKMRESLASYERNIDNNTSSSNVALSRKQRARAANILQTSELYGNKENLETELINKDKLNQQTVTNDNIKAYNEWAKQKAIFNNMILEKKAENNIATIGNINTGIQDVIQRKQKRKSENNTITAMTLSNPNLPAEMYYASGIWNKELYDKYRKTYPLNK